MKQTEHQKLSLWSAFFNSELNLVGSANLLNNCDSQYVCTIMYPEKYSSPRYGLKTLKQNVLVNGPAQARLPLRVIQSVGSDVCDAG